MRIAVLGGGNGSHAAAADLSDQGHEVRFWRRDAARFGELATTRKLMLKDIAGRREAAIAMVTAELGAAVRDAELILIPTPAFAQEDIARALAPHLADGQVIFLPPGTFGSVAMMQTLRRAGCTAEVAFAETGTLPWLTRLHGAEVAITMRAVRLPTGVFPADKAAQAFAVLCAAFPAVEPIEDALAGALMNAGPLEHFERWDIHNEGTQPSIRRVTNALDEERMAIRVALGYTGEHFPLRDHYESDRWMYGDAHQRLTDSGDWREHIVLTEHRYMTEDIHYGLAFLVSVADWAGVAAPLASGLLALASAICSRDLRAGNRTLEAMGLAALDRAGMRRLLHSGRA
jgi:opine dehydrogenase